MRIPRILFPWIMMVAATCGAQAGGLITIYQYAPPPPMLQLSSSSPTDNQSFNPSPEDIVLNFSMDVNPMTSYVGIFDPYNQRIDTANNVTEMPKSPGAGVRVLHIKLPPKLSTGDYRIEWQAKCACSENLAASGTIRFNVY